MDSKRIDLADRGGMEPQVGLFYTMQQELRRRVKAAVAELTPAQLAWVPEKSGNSIAELLLHIAEAELFWIQFVCMGQELTAEQNADYRTELFGKPDAPPPAEHPVAWFVDKLDDASRITTAYYTTLTDLALAELKDFTDDEGNHYEFTVQWVLYHLLEHEAGHRAQMLTIRRVLQDKNIG
jgi:uncharacterized damage-inducible protein DinB